MSDVEKPRRIALAITGASGSVYGLRLLRVLAGVRAVELHLTVSAAAYEVLRVEHGIEAQPERFEPRIFGLPEDANVSFHASGDLAAPLASGSFRVEGMAVVPCSMGCAARIAHGISGDLVERAADVMLKERRKLVLVPRETPLSAVHLENLARLARLGVVVLPAAPGFYGRPRTVDDLVDFVVARILDHLDVPHALGPRWEGPGSRP